MRQQQPTYRYADAQIIGGLVQVALAALQDKFPKVRVDLEELQSLVDALEVLDPNGSKSAFVRATLHLVKHDWRDAIHIFRALAAESKCMPYSRAMLAYGLNRARDPEWRLEAESLRDSDGAGISSLMRSLMVESDLEAAAESAKRTGVLVLPESVTREEAQDTQESHAKEREADHSRAGAGMPAWLNYALRA